MIRISICEAHRDGITPTTLLVGVLCNDLQYFADGCNRRMCWPIQRFKTQAVKWIIRSLGFRPLRITDSIKLRMLRKACGCSKSSRVDTGRQSMPAHPNRTTRLGSPQWSGLGFFLRSWSCNLVVAICRTCSEKLKISWFYSRKTISCGSERLYFPPAVTPVRRIQKCTYLSREKPPMNFDIIHW